MALRPDRNYTNEVDVSFFMNETGEKGEVLVFTSAGSGAAMDDATAIVTTPVTIISGKRVAGVLLNDVVNLDLTRTHINWHKDEVQLGGKVSLLRRGVIVTNVINTGTDAVDTIAAGSPAYVGFGAITSGGTSQGWASTVKPEDDGQEDILYRIGTFLSTKDSDGYAKLHVNIA